MLNNKEVLVPGDMTWIKVRKLPGEKSYPLEAKCYFAARLRR